MITPILTALTNRANGFIWPRFGADPLFVPVRLPDYAEVVRQELQLHDETTDYFVVGVLQSLLGCPWVGEQACELTELTFLYTYVYPQDGWVGGTLKASSKDPATFAFVPTSWPVVLDWSLSYLEPQKSVLKNGTTSEVVTAVVNPDNRLSIEWPARLNARGVIDLAGSWEAGAEVNFTHHPGAYPYSAAVAAIGALRETNQLLLRTGTATAWHAARSDMERIALLALGLIRTYRKE